MMDPTNMSDVGSGGKWWMPKPTIEWQRQVVDAKVKQWAAEANGGQWSHMADAEAEW